MNFMELATYTCIDKHEHSAAKLNFSANQRDLCLCVTQRSYAVRCTLILRAARAVRVCP